MSLQQIRHLDDVQIHYLKSLMNAMYFDHLRQLSQPKNIYSSYLCQILLYY